jgi:hypothetical protein
VTHPTGGILYLKLRDDPATVQTLTLPVTAMNATTPAAALTQPAVQPPAAPAQPEMEPSATPALPGAPEVLPAASLEPAAKPEL